MTFQYKLSARYMPIQHHGFGSMDFCNFCAIAAFEVDAAKYQISGSFEKRSILSSKDTQRFTPDASITY